MSDFDEHEGQRARRYVGHERPEAVRPAATLPEPWQDAPVVIADQPPPKTNTNRPVWELVIEDMHARDRVGRERYGTPLQAHNGRDPLVDAYQEALDLAVYMRQAIEERTHEPCSGDVYEGDLNGSGSPVRWRFVERSVEGVHHFEPVDPEVCGPLVINTHGNPFHATARRCGMRFIVPELAHRLEMALELRRLREREDALLAKNTELLERLRAADWYQCLREFFVIAGQRIPSGPPAVPPEAELRLGVELVAEEMVELLESCLGKPSPLDSAAWEAWNNLGAVVTEYTRKAPIAVDMVGAVDGIADSLYVLLGLAVRLGVDIPKVFEIVHAANMLKGSGPVDPVTGKKLKPPGFKPPDVGAELRRQGWRCSRCNETGAYVLPFEGLEGTRIECGCGAKP